MYKISAAMDLANGRPSFLIPIFVNERTNIPYVQIMNRHYFVEDFMPFYSVDEYPCVGVLPEVEARLKEPAIFVIRHPNGELLCGPLSDVFRWYDELEDEIEASPLLALQMSRILSERQAKQIDRIISAGNFYFREEAQRSAWIESTAELVQIDDVIWKSILNKTKDNNFRREENDIINFKGASFEFIFDFLCHNFESTHWEGLWLRLWNERFSDERLLFLAHKWIYSRFSPGQECVSATNVFCAVVDGMVSLGLEDDNFSEFLFEQVSGLIFFSDSFPIPFKTKQKIFYLMGSTFSQNDFQELVINVLNSTFFDKYDTLLLGAQLFKALGEKPKIDSDFDAKRLQSILPKIERYGDDKSFRPVIKRVRAAIRSKA